MASNILTPQPLTSQNVSLQEDIFKMWQSAAPFNELVEKEGVLKRPLPPANFPQMEPAAKRQAPPGQFPVAVQQQMQNSIQAQQQLLQHQQQQQAIQQAYARGQLSTNFVLPPVTVAGLNNVQMNALQNQQFLAQIEKINKESQALQQQQIQQAQQAQLQAQQAQLQQHQMQIHQQQLQQLIQQTQQQQRVLHVQSQQQAPVMQAIPGIPAQLIQAQQRVQPVQAAIDPRQFEQYAQILKAAGVAAPPQVLQAQQAQLMSQSAPVGVHPQMIPQTTGRRQTIGPATITPQMVGALPRMHRPSPQLIPTSSPLQMIPSSSANATPAKSPFAAPTAAARPPTAPTNANSSPASSATTSTVSTQIQQPVIPVGLKGPNEPAFLSFLAHSRIIEQQIHNMLGDGMVRLPSSTKD